MPVTAWALPLYLTPFAFAKMSAQDVKTAAEPFQLSLGNEKTLKDGRQSPALEVDWSQEEETRAKRKMDFIIMPLLTLGFFCLREFLCRDGMNTF